jgi:hypothetical protein
MDVNSSVLLDYWIEDKVDGDYAIFWVEITDDLSSNDVTIYIYYGNSTAVTTSNGLDTFLFFDDFVNSNQWNLDAHAEVVGGQLHFSNGISQTGTYTKVSYSFGSANLWRIMMKANVVSGVELDLWSTYISSSDYALLICSNTSNNWKIRIDASTNADNNAFTNNVYYLWELRHGAINEWQSFQDRIQVGNDKIDAHVTTSPEPIRLGSYPSNSEVYIDWIFASKYVNPEPAHNIWGAEEDGAPIDPTNFLGVCNGSTQIDLSWIDNATSETAYYVERDDGGWHDLAGALPVDTQTYSDLVVCGIAYSYRIRVYDGVRDLYSNYVTLSTSIICSCPMPPPVLVSRVGGSKKQTIVKKEKKPWEYMYPFEHKPLEKIIAGLSHPIEETIKIIASISNSFQETKIIKSRIALEKFAETIPVLSNIIIKFHETQKLSAALTFPFEETPKVAASTCHWFYHKKKVVGETKSLEEDILESLEREEEELELEREEDED